MPDFVDQVRAVLCTATSGSLKKWSQVKHSSFDNSMPNWKDGKLHVAESHRENQFLLIVEYRNGPAKIFKLNNNLKNKVHPPSNPGRCMISLKNGTTIQINQAKPDLVGRLSDTIDTITLQAKSSKIGIPLAAGHNTSPPWMRTVTSPATKSKPSRDQARTPRQTSPSGGEGFTKTKLRTPSSSKKVHSPWRSSKRKTPDDEVFQDDEENPGVSMLFSDMTDKENQYTPSRNDRQSVYHVRTKNGGSMFMEAFEEKQQMSENKRKGPDPAVAVSHNFYNRNKQIANYSGSQLFTSTPRTSSQSEEPAKKSTPGYLVSRGSSNSIPRPKFSFKTWSNPSKPEGYQQNLQGFSNLGNTCYMNAILQSLLGLQCFIQDLQNLALIRALPKMSLYRALSHLLYAKQNKKSSLPHLERVKAAISATATRFSGFMQHDAHEFLCQCLDQLKEDVDNLNKRKAEKGIPLDAKDSTSPPSQVVPSDQSGEQAKFLCPVNQNFEIEVVHSILCQECGEEVTKKESFNDLSLDLPRTNEAFTLQTALDSFCASEKLEYACAKCDCKEAKVSHKFTKLPRVLVLHLKRYAYDSESLANSKLVVGVGIPRFLTLAWHTTKTTSLPPPKSGAAPVPHMSLSPLRDNPRTPSNLDSPDRSGPGSGSRKKLLYENSRSGFQFKRIRTLSESPKKESGHFISRYENDVTTVKKTTTDTGDHQFAEMDEEQQLAFVLELSRKEAEAKAEASGKVKGQTHVKGRNVVAAFEDDVTDEELVQALDDTLEGEKETSRPRKRSMSDSDDDLPVGYCEDVELSDFERALKLSKETQREEQRREEQRSQVGFASSARSVLRTTANVGLLGGARRHFVEEVVGSHRTQMVEGRPKNGRKEHDVQKKGMWNVESIDSERGLCGLLGGAKRQRPGSPLSGTEEPMDFEDDPPLAFSLGSSSDQDDPGKPKLWDTTYVSSRSQSATRNRTALKGSTHVMSTKTLGKNAEHIERNDSHQDVQLVDSGHSTECSSDNSADHQGQDAAIDATEDTIQRHSVHDSGVKLTASPSMMDNEDRLWKSKTNSCQTEQNSALLSRGINRDENSAVDCDDDAALWKPNKACKKNVFQEFSPSKSSSTSFMTNEMETPFNGQTMVNRSSAEEAEYVKDHEQDQEEEDRKIADYEDIKAREEEDIRRATELSMREAKEMAEKEAAEILRAQEMSLKDLHQAQLTTPKSWKEGDAPTHTSPVYTKEQKEILSNHSEDGNMSNAYRLISIVSHIGHSSSTGHYVCDVYQADKKCWLSYDDTSVMKREERQLREERKRTGYIFFYQAKEFL